MTLTKKLYVVFIVISVLLMGAIPTVKSSDIGIYSMGLSLIWNKTWRGGYENAQAMDVVADENGNAYVTGYVRNSTTHDEDIIVLKFNEQGDVIWNKTYGGTGNQEGMALTIDNKNNLYVVGDDYNANAGVILAYNSNGDLLWHNTSALSFYDVCISNNSLYACGVASSYNAALVRYDLFGNLTMSKSYNLGVWTGFNSLVISNSNVIYCSGGYNNTGDITGHVLLTKIDATGNLIWNKTWVGGVKIDVAGAILLDETNNTLFLTGNTENYGSAVIDVLFLRYDTSGDYFVNKTWGSSGEDAGASQAFSSNGSIYIPVYYNSGDKCALLKCNENYSTLDETYWTEGTNYVNIAKGIAINKTGMIYITGNTGYLSSTEYLFLLKYKETAVPEFATIILPTIAVIAIFIAILKRKCHDRTEALSFRTG